MFDIGWSEMAMILGVALVVIGPKDLPRVARQIGRWTAKGRALARDFQRSIEDMAREADLQDIKDDIAKMGRGGLGQSIERTIDPEGDIRRAIEAPQDRPFAEPARSEPVSSEPTMSEPAAGNDLGAMLEEDDAAERLAEEKEQPHAAHASDELGPVEVQPVAAGGNAASSPPEGGVPASVGKS